MLGNEMKDFFLSEKDVERRGAVVCRLHSKYVLIRTIRHRTSHLDTTVTVTEALCL